MEEVTEILKEEIERLVRINKKLEADIRAEIAATICEIVKILKDISC